MSDIEVKAAAYDYVWRGDAFDRVGLFRSDEDCAIEIVCHGRGYVKTHEQWHNLAQMQEECEQPEAYLVTFRETRKSGSVACVTVASLLPSEPTIFYPEDEDIEKRELLKVTPLYAKPNTD